MRRKSADGGNALNTTHEVTPAALITARLDRLPMTRQVWTMVLLIALGGTFEVYDLFFTGYVAPGCSPTRSSRRRRRACSA